VDRDYKELTVPAALVAAYVIGLALVVTGLWMRIREVRQQSVRNALPISLQFVGFACLFATTGALMLSLGPDGGMAAALAIVPWAAAAWSVWAAVRVTIRARR
jgi:hypothetical protein